MEGGDDQGKKKNGFQGNLGSGSCSLKNEQQPGFHLDSVPLSSSGNVSVEEIVEEEEEESKGVIDIDGSEQEEEEEERGRLGNEGGECGGSVDENRKYSAEEKGKGKLSMEEKMAPEEGVEMMPEDGNAATVGSGTISEEEMAVNGLIHIWNWSREYEAKQRSIERVRMRTRNRRDKQRIAEIPPTFTGVQPVLENDVVGEPVIGQEVEDQPGPFSTAMRRVRRTEREPDIAGKKESDS